jgi:5-oxoprolinase (ATP-hydrolysing) subunit A
VAAIDLNADLGEEVTDDLALDTELLGVVTSANVACGFHAGTPAIMAQVCALAAERGVSVGAQVSYDDRANFGRVPRDVPAGVLRDQVAEQVEALRLAAEGAGTTVRYLKPHGALYHRVLEDPVQATAVLDGSGGLPVLTMPGELGRLAQERGRRVVLEGFPDRSYTAEGRLVDRGEPGAVRHDAAAVCDAALALAHEVESLCVHGDTPGAVALATSVRRALEDAGWRLRPFAAPF